MASPRTPADFAALVSDPASSLCGNFINTVLKLPTYLSQFISWLLDSSGNISTAVRNQIVRPGDLIFSAAPLAEDATRLLCDGRQVAQATYAALFAAIGATWGAGAGAGNFFLPDYRAKFPVGVGSFASGAAVALAGAVGEEKHLLLDAEIGYATTHKHVTGRQEAASPNNNYCLATGALSEAALSTLRPAIGGSGTTAETTDAETGVYFQTGKPQLAGGGAIPAITAHNNLPPAVGLYIYVAT